MLLTWPLLILIVGSDALGVVLFWLYIVQWRQATSSSFPVFGSQLWIGNIRLGAISGNQELFSVEAILTFRGGSCIA